MKITLSYKSYIIKASSLFILISLIVSMPNTVNAGFFDFINGKATAEEIDMSKDQHNSQTIPLFETSIDPDMKNADKEKDIIIVDDGALLPNDGTNGSGSDFASNGEIIVYEVQEGDTLSEIALLYDVSINTIKWENNLTGQTLKIGQKLNILPVTGVKHIIKSGDTLKKIAVKYDAEVSDIELFNDIMKDKGLKQGDILYVPNGIIKPVIIVQKTPSKKPISSDSGSKVSSGYYLRPAYGPITSPYGSRRGAFHSGIDIGNVRGTPVVAAADGVVVGVFSSCVEGRRSCGGRYGNYIVIEHDNGTSTRYAHLSSDSVSIGQQVSKGEQIGTIGNTGRSTGPHLHFQIEKANGSTMRPVF